MWSLRWHFKNKSVTVTVCHTAEHYGERVRWLKQCRLVVAVVWCVYLCGTVLLRLSRQMKLLYRFFSVHQEINFEWWLQRACGKMACLMTESMIQQIPGRHEQTALSMSCTAKSIGSREMTARWTRDPGCTFHAVCSVLACCLFNIRDTAENIVTVGWACDCLARHVRSIDMIQCVNVLVRAKNLIGS